MEKGGLAAALDAVGLTRASRIGHADELRLGLRGTSRRVWGRRGVEVRQRRQLRYDWWYLFAAVDGQAGTVSWTRLDSMKAADLAPLMEALRANAPLDAVVWDGASSHRDDAVRAVGVPLIDLPPYSPELNPAERLFEEVRRHTEGRVYATLADKVAAVNAFLDELDADPARVRSLCGWDWINAAIATLPDALEKAA
ncbi:MAG TPA: transposase [Umezawaea sp.]|nr:transposase [Umezawaea sp.]